MGSIADEIEDITFPECGPTSSGRPIQTLSSDRDISDGSGDASDNSKVTTCYLPVPLSVTAKDATYVHLPNIGNDARSVIAHIRGLTHTTNSVGALQEAFFMLMAVNYHFLRHQARDNDMSAINPTSDLQMCIWEYILPSGRMWARLSRVCKSEHLWG